MPPDAYKHWERWHPAQSLSSVSSASHWRASTHQMVQPCPKSLPADSVQRKACFAAAVTHFPAVFCWLTLNSRHPQGQAMNKWEVQLQRLSCLKVGFISSTCGALKVYKLFRPSLDQTELPTFQLAMSSTGPQLGQLGDTPGASDSLRWL